MKASTTILACLLASGCQQAAQAGAVYCAASEARPTLDPGSRHDASDYDRMLDNKVVFVGVVGPRKIVEGPKAGADADEDDFATIGDVDVTLRIKGLAPGHLQERRSYDRDVKTTTAEKRSIVERDSPNGHRILFTNPHRLASGQTSFETSDSCERDYRAPKRIDLDADRRGDETLEELRALNIARGDGPSLYGKTICTRLRPERKSGPRIADDPRWPAVKQYLERNDLEQVDVSLPYSPNLRMGNFEGGTATSFFRYDDAKRSFVVSATEAESGVDLHTLPLGARASIATRPEGGVTIMINDENGGVVEIDQESKDYERDIRPFGHPEPVGHGTTGVIQKSDPKITPEARHCLFP